jgi:cytochrome c556
MMKRLSFIIVLAAVFFTGIAYGADKQESQNLIMKEMVALDKAFKTAIDAVVLNQLERIAPAFEDVHKVRKQVEHAVKEREKIILPKNQSLFKVFVKMDDKLHHEVKILVDASKKKNIRAVQRQVNRLLNMCARCHGLFRK